MTLGNDNGTDGQTDRVRRNMRPPPREEGRIIRQASSQAGNVSRMRAQCDDHQMRAGVVQSLRRINGCRSNELMIDSCLVRDTDANSRHPRQTHAELRQFLFDWIRPRVPRLGLQLRVTCNRCYSQPITNLPPQRDDYGGFLRSTTQTFAFSHVEELAGG